MPFGKRWPIITISSTAAGGRSFESRTDVLLRRDDSVSPPQQTRLEPSSAVPRDGQVGVLRVLETQVEAAAGERRDFLDPRHVDDRAAVNAEEVPRIQQRLQLCDRVVHAVRLPALDGECQLVLGEEMRHTDQIDEPEALAQA